MQLNLAIGQYIKGNTWIYKLDPRLKISSVVILMILLFLLPNLYCVIGGLSLLFIIALSSRLPLRNILRSLKPVIFLSMFSFILQILYTNNGDLLYTLNLNMSFVTILTAIFVFLIYLLTSKFIKFKIMYFLLLFATVIFCFINIEVYRFHTFNIEIYNQGLINGGYFVLRIFAVVMLSTLLTLTTSTIDLNSGLESILKPLKVIKFPVAEISLMISLTLRFVPTLLLETNKILKAQASRGVDFEEGSIMKKIKQIVTLLIPMFVVSFKRADDLACAMESRGYVIGNQRTSYNVLKFKLRDYIGVFCLLCLIFIVIYLRIVL